MLTQQDLEHPTRRDMTLEQIEGQLKIFQEGIPFAKLLKPCTRGDGITRLTVSEIETYAEHFDEPMLAGRTTKFVPASGAASRMVKSLLACLEQCRQSVALPSPDTPTTHPDHQAFHQFLNGLEQFAFYEDLRASLWKEGLDIQRLVAKNHYGPLLEHLLTSTGLKYANVPKGLIKFHKYPDGSRTPLEEHLVEAAAYAKDANQHARLHFTVSPEHLPLFKSHLEEVRGQYEQSDMSYLVSWSTQKPSTDTIAVDLHNRPFRDQQGRLVFRPAGHGALLENLNDLQGDLIFIKNIDNVVHEHLTEDTHTYKRALGGYLVALTRRIHASLSTMATGRIDADHIEELADFAYTTLAVAQPQNWKTWEIPQKREFLISALNRPIRVCGMVNNTGDPGGGPFWVKHEDGSCSLQIVEASQIDPDCPTQQAILQSSTHFNPVDMVCAVRDYQGKPFDLRRFSDPHTGFISRKSHEGRDLKALELPGLWNGAMAYWLTVFIEVPRTTFNPVKTLNDLLLPAHQPG